MNEITDQNELKKTAGSASPIVERCVMLPVGTRIRFKRTLTQEANEESPGITFARKHDLGTITGHGCWEGYWCKWDKWPTPFGIQEKDFEVIAT